MARINLPKHIENFLRYLSHAEEKANEDLALQYFRHVFPKFNRQSEAHRADGYVPGHFVLELKSKTNDWYAALMQGLAYKRELDFTLIVVAAKGFLAIWRVEDIPDEIQEAVHNKKTAPSKIGKEVAKSFKHLEKRIYKKAIWCDDQLYGLFIDNPVEALSKITSFEKTLKSCKKIREKMTKKNFTKILKNMVEYFDPAQPIKAVSAFYSMIYSWGESSIIKISNRERSGATLDGEQIKNLVPDKRLKFKEFIEKYYVSLAANESMDDFFAQYDKALDAVDKNFRIQNGIFFTDLNLARFAIWFAKKNIRELGKDYIVIDPACGSGNLVTSWRSPLKLRHKVVSEIEPELLYAVEKRMEHDSDNSVFTVIPKIETGEGLNFLDKSAEEYIKTINDALEEKGLTFNKPIAFLCNPPYRGDDDKTALPITYEIHQSIIDIVGEEAKAERFCCFLAQMKLICDHAANSDLPDDSRLLLFTQTGWLTNRPSFNRLRKEIFSSFNFLDGMLVNSREFFDVKGKFPIAFTIWSYKKNKERKSANEQEDIVYLKDLTWLKREDISSFPWGNEKKENNLCYQIFKDQRVVAVPFGINRLLLKNWLAIKRQDFIRSKRKNEINNITCSGLPKNDLRLNGKCAYGQNDGSSIGFMDDLTLCRINKIQVNIPWFHLDARFMRCNRNRCFSGPPDNRGYYASNYIEAVQVFLWYALARTFAQIGYPLWANTLELWVPEIPKFLERKALKFIFSIGFAENECVEATFPAHNPIKNVPEICCHNPMTPLDANSFWTKNMSSYFSTDESSLPDKLVQAVNRLYDEWKKRFSNDPQMVVSYKRPYFIGRASLKPIAGIVQIKDYAKEMNDQLLLDLYGDMQRLLKETKQAFYNLLIDANGINYFGNKEINNAKKELAYHKKTQPDFYKKRVILSGMIVKSLHQSTSFGRTKFAKVFYLVDMLCEQDLKTKYYREAAGPVDYNLLYDKKNNIESLALENDYFSTKKMGKTIKFIPGKNINKIDEHIEKMFRGKAVEIKRVIKLFEKLTTEQAEIVATLFACWNDLLIERQKITDETIIKEARYTWHISKQRFGEEKLMKALAWMKKNSLIPKGIKSHTQNKKSK